MDGPGLGLFLVEAGLTGGQVDCQVGAKPVIVEEIALDLLALVAQRDHELVEAVPHVVLHDVPDDRVTPDLDQWLRPDLSLF